MPWTPADASEYTKKADTPAKAEKWAHVANAVLEKTGDDGKAIRIANAAVGEHKKK